MACGDPHAKEIRNRHAALAWKEEAWNDYAFSYQKSETETASDMEAGVPTGLESCRGPKSDFS